MTENEPDVEVFYADPVDEDGNVIATARVSVTYSNGTARATKVPHSEMAVEGMPTIRVREEDFPDD